MADSAAKNAAGARERRLAWRSCFLCLVPAMSVLFGFTSSQVSFCMFVSLVGCLLEASILWKMGFAECCRKVPFILRLMAVGCFQLQACWLLAPAGFWSSDAPAKGEATPPVESSLQQASSLQEASSLQQASSLQEASSLQQASSLRQASSLQQATEPASVAQPSPQEVSTLSVVLPCANETDFVMKTVRSIFEATPEGELHEIIVVDDFSVPHISSLLNMTELESHRARILRHESPQGLIRSKAHGANVSEGDVIVFLDCHVKPATGWTEDIFSNIRQNPKRIVVPTITSLNPDTWEEMGTSGGRKMCLTWNADFYWCNGYPGPYVPIMSGGLLALSRYWWKTSGGYDSEMMAWGGENLDQSLRTWLCGGEIVVADTSRVAHMWRDPSKPKTQLHYSIPTEHVRRNRMRASTSWMSEWVQKVRTFPEFEDFRDGGPLHVGSLENVDVYKRQLKCDGFKSYLNRFKDLYLGIGLFPEEVFNLRHRKTGLCMHHELGYHSNQGGGLHLRPCSQSSEAQRWHAANAKPGGKECCSGIKLWNLDVCMSAEQQAFKAEACLVFGEMPNQHISITDKGRLQWSGNGLHYCVNAFGTGNDKNSLKATLFAGKSCAAKVEQLTIEGTSQFRIVRTDTDGTKQCLSVSGVPENSEPLRFSNCVDNNKDQLFQIHQSFEDGRQQISHQIRTSRGMCIDASHGGGPIEYVCHDATQAQGSVEQHWHMTAGEIFLWEAREENGIVPFCVDPATQLAQLAPCAGTADTPKAGQGFRKHDVRESDGSFQLREPESGNCLAPHKTDGQPSVPIYLFSTKCVEGEDHRWRYVEGQLRSMQVANHCIDAGDSETPLVYPCYPANSNPKQTYTFHENGWIEVPRSWGDNGRNRFLAKCLDSRPYQPTTVHMVSCDQGEIDEWERLWPEVPLETQLWKKANSKTDAFLKKS